MSHTGEAVIAVTAILAAIVAAVWELWFLWIGLTGGELPIPFLDWHVVDGSFIFALLAFLFVTPILVGAVGMVARAIAVVLAAPFEWRAQRRGRAMSSE
jgi:hypothetical protein